MISAWKAKLRADFLMFFYCIGNCSRCEQFAYNKNTFSPPRLGEGGLICRRQFSYFIGNCSILETKRNAPMGNIGTRKKTNGLKDKKTFNTGIVGEEIIFI